MLEAIDELAAPRHRAARLAELEQPRRRRGQRGGHRALPDPGPRTCSDPVTVARPPARRTIRRSQDSTCASVCRMLYCRTIVHCRGPSRPWPCAAPRRSPLPSRPTSRTPSFAVSSRPAPAFPEVALAAELEHIPRNRPRGAPDRRRRRPHPDRSAARRVRVAAVRPGDLGDHQPACPARAVCRPPGARGARVGSLDAGGGPRRLRRAASRRWKRPTRQRSPTRTSPFIGRCSSTAATTCSSTAWRRSRSCPAGSS